MKEPSARALLQQQSEAVRQLYFLELRFWYEKHRPGCQVPTADRKYPRIDGGKDARGVNHKPFWPKIVQYALKNGADPCELVRAVFQMHKGHNSPACFTNEAALAAYRQFSKFSVEEAQYDFMTFQEEAKSAFWQMEQTIPLPPDKLWRQVILSPDLHGGPLFRYCLAVSVKQEDLAARCCHSAMMEYIKYPDEYDSALGKFIPHYFRSGAKHLREKLLRGY